MSDTGATEALRDPETSVITLVAIITIQYGLEDFLDRDVDTLETFLDLKEDFGVVIPEELENKLNAAKELLTSDLPTEDPNVFYSVVTAFSSGDIGDIASIVLEGKDLVTDISIVEILWAIHEMAILRGVTDDQMRDVLGPSVVAYITKIVRHEAEANDDVPEDTQNIDDLSEEPVFMRALIEQNDEVKRQLIRIGISPDNADKMLELS